VRRSVDDCLALAKQSRQRGDGSLLTVVQRGHVKLGPPRARLAAKAAVKAVRTRTFRRAFASLQVQSSDRLEVMQRQPHERRISSRRQPVTRPPPRATSRESRPEAGPCETVATCCERRLALVQPPPTQYVERDGISIAYQVVGDGPVDLLISPGFISHLDLQWTSPGHSRFLARLASFSWTR
jgi:hypothetical protein